MNKVAGKLIQTILASGQNREIWLLIESVIFYDSFHDYSHGGTILNTTTKIVWYFIKIFFQNKGEFLYGL